MLVSRSRLAMVVAATFMFVLSGVLPLAMPASAASPSDSIINSPPAYDWSMFLHDAMHGGYVVSPSPHSNHIEGSSNFRGPIGGSVASSGDVLYFGAGSTFYAVNSSTLSKIWTHATGGSILSSPAVSSGAVFFGSSDGTVYALSTTDGSKLWGYPTGAPVVSSPAVDNSVSPSLVFIGSESATMFAFQQSAPGMKAWNFLTGGAIKSSAAVSSGQVVFGSDDGKVYFLSEATGKLDGSFTTSGPVDSSPSISGSTAFIGSNDSKVYAINTLTYSQVWSFRTRGPVVASPVVFNNEVLVGSTDGFLYALNGTTGSLIWKTSIGATASSGAIGYTAGNDYGTRKSQSVPGVPTVYVANMAGTVYAVTISDGTTKWSYSTGSPTAASPALVYTKIYIGVSGGTLYQIGELKQSGAVATFTTQSVLQSSFAHGTNIYLGINEAWGKYGMHSTVLVSVFNPSGTEILTNASMIFVPGANSQYNFYYGWLIPGGAAPGKYKITVLSEDANPKFNSSHPRAAGYLLYRGQFTVK